MIPWFLYWVDPHLVTSIFRSRIFSLSATVEPSALIPIPDFSPSHHNRRLLSKNKFYYICACRAENPRTSHPSLHTSENVKPFRHPTRRKSKLTLLLSNLFQHNFRYWPNFAHPSRLKILRYEGGLAIWNGIKDIQFPDAGCIETVLRGADVPLCVDQP